MSCQGGMCNCAGGRLLVYTAWVRHCLSFFSKSYTLFAFRAGCRNGPPWWSRLPNPVSRRGSVAGCACPPPSPPASPRRRGSSKTGRRSALCGPRPPSGSWSSSSRACCPRGRRRERGRAQAAAARLLSRARRRPAWTAANSSQGWM